MKALFSLFIPFVAAMLAGCAATGGSKITTHPDGRTDHVHLYAWRLFNSSKDREIDLQEDASQNPGEAAGKMAGMRIRERVIEEDNTELSDSYFTVQGTKILTEGYTSQAKIAADADVAKGAQYTDRFNSANTPAFETPETKAVWGPNKPKP